MTADDILVLSQEPSNAVPVLLEVIEDLSGYKINWQKSKAMLVSPTCTPVSLLLTLNGSQKV